MKKEEKKLIMVNNFSFKNCCISCFFVALLGCNNNTKRSMDIKKDSITEKGSTNTSNPKMDFDFYLNNKNVSELAKNYYLGKFKPADNSETEQLLSLSLTPDSILRSFYVWCLNDIISNADGALMEYVGEPARKYIEEFPIEFLSNLDNHQINKIDWKTAINYSGYYSTEQSENPNIVLANFIRAIRKKCTNCSNHQMERLIQFAQECFSG